MIAVTERRIERGVRSPIRSAERDVVRSIDFTIVLDRGDLILAVASLAVDVRLRHHDGGTLHKRKKKADTVGREITLEGHDTSGSDASRIKCRHPMGHPGIDLLVAD